MADLNVEQQEQAPNKDSENSQRQLIPQDHNKIEVNEEQKPDESTAEKVSWDMLVPI